MQIDRVGLRVKPRSRSVRVIMKGITDLMTGAVVGPDGVPADVLAAAVVGGALVLVGEEDGGEPVLLHAVVGEEL